MVTSVTIAISPPSTHFYSSHSLWIESTTYLKLNEPTFDQICSVEGEVWHFYDSNAWVLPGNSFFQKPVRHFSNDHFQSVISQLLLNIGIWLNDSSFWNEFYFWFMWIASLRVWPEAKILRRYVYKNRYFKGRLDIFQIIIFNISSSAPTR